jgi:tRNA threonylcarbamoyladenosine biosynthesis protein TsaB
LRIACSIAKGLAYAHDLDLFPVSSLAAITWAVRKQLNDTNVPVLAVLDARMHELYWGFFETSSYNAEEHVNKAEHIKLIETQSLVLAGIGIETYWPNIPELIKEKTIHQLPIYPNAAAMIEMVCAIGISPVSVAQAQPVYVRNQVTQGDACG